MLSNLFVSIFTVLQKFSSKKIEFDILKYSVVQNVSLTCKSEWETEISIQRGAEVRACILPRCYILCVRKLFKFA